MSGAYDRAEARVWIRTRRGETLSLLHSDAFGWLDAAGRAWLPAGTGWRCERSRERAETVVAPFEVTS